DKQADSRRIIAKRHHNRIRSREMFRQNQVFYNHCPVGEIIIVGKTQPDCKQKKHRHSNPKAQSRRRDVRPFHFSSEQIYEKYQTTGQTSSHQNIRSFRKQIQKSSPEKEQADSADTGKRNKPDLYLSQSVYRKKI